MHAPPAPSTPDVDFPRRRDVRRAERHATSRRRSPRVAGPRAQRAGGRGWWPRGVSSVAVAALVVPFALPVSAELLDPSSPAAPVAASVAGQSLVVAGDVTAYALRDSFDVGRAMPAGLRPYAYTADSFDNDPSSDVQWPFDRGVPIGDGFGWRRAPCSGCSSNHQGLDMTPGIGTPIQAIADGIVVEVGKPRGLFGVYAVIEHEVDGRTVRSRYAHMLMNSLDLEVGDTVRAGEYVGMVGNTGISTGPHLHFELEVGGRPIDPSAWLRERAGR